MTFAQFLTSLHDEQAPSSLSLPLQALWYDGKGNWDQAHDLADQVHTPVHNWVHAYLHRKEGDTWNANYWYRKANRVMPALSLQAEWEAMVQELLGEG